jgi:predicted nucleic acid-binding protein
MNPENHQVVIYWDASAILSALIKDVHSEKAQAWANREGIHLISSLAYAEVMAVISRMQRERVMADVLVEAALKALKDGPWRPLNLEPTPGHMLGYSRRWPLRGADLWHLACAKSAHEHLPEVKVLTFDTKLKAAARGEGIGL